MKINFCRKILIYIGHGLEYESIMIKELETFLFRYSEDLKMILLRKFVRVHRISFVLWRMVIGIESMDHFEFWLYHHRLFLIVRRTFVHSHFHSKNQIFIQISEIFRLLYRLKDRKLNIDTFDYRWYFQQEIPNKNEKVFKYKKKLMNNYTVE